MTMSESAPQPFSTFGAALKKLRQNVHETQAEVSGAVEIDPSSLKSYEMGEARPSEDVLMLLIQHFSLKDEKATELWRLAGYADTPMDEAHFYANDDFGNAKSISPLQHRPDETPIVYTDMIQVMVNNYGVILQFLQGSGAGNNPLAVARVGMSKEHAKSIIEVLRTTLDQAAALEQKAKIRRRLPDGK